jgi:hypothetical protein
MKTSATLFAILLITACVATPEPEDGPPAVGDVEPLACIVITPTDAIDGPSEIVLVNECASPVQCSILGGGLSWSESIDPDGSWTSPAVCGDFAVDCGGAVMAVSIACTA